MDYLGDILGIILTFIYVFLVIGAAEFLRKRLSFSSNFTRKIIHIGVGNWIFLWPFTFQHWYMVCIPPAVFVVLNYVSYRKEVFKAMERKEKAGGLGTVYYAFSLTVLSIAFWYIREAWIAALGMMLMAWADGLADVIGRKYGSHKYAVLGSVKSIEGSIGFFIVGIMSSIATISFFTAFWSLVLPQSMFLISLIIAGLGTIIEAFSPKGTDNLTVPIISSILLLLFV
jgi:phytol kinase